MASASVHRPKAPSEIVDALHHEQRGYPHEAWTRLEREARLEHGELAGPPSRQRSRRVGGIQHLPLRGRLLPGSRRAARAVA